jgi:hypothetical protein
MNQLQALFYSALAVIKDKINENKFSLIVSIMPANSKQKSACN